MYNSPAQLGSLMLKTLTSKLYILYIKNPPCEKEGWMFDCLIGRVYPKCQDYVEDSHGKQCVNHHWNGVDFNQLTLAT